MNLQIQKSYQPKTARSVFRLFLTFCIISSAHLSAMGSNRWVTQGPLIRIDQCPAKLGFHTTYSEAGDVCVLPNGKYVEGYEGQSIKVLVERHGSIKYNKEKHQVWLIVQMNPFEASGTFIHTPGFMDKFNALAAGVAIPSTTTTAPLSSPAQVPSQTQTGGTGSYQSTYSQGVPQCLSESPGKLGTLFKNVCSMRITVVWAGQFGRGSITLAPGDQSDGSMTNVTGGAKGVYKTYVCPLFTAPVDLNNNEIRTPVERYRCLK